MDKAGFTILCMLLGGKDIKIPKQFYDTINEDNYKKVLKKLSDVERTIHFLISSVLGAQDVSIENNGKRCVFQCEKLIIIIEEDRLSPKKCKLIPIKDNEMLEQYHSELNEKNYYGEEQL